MDMNQKRKMRMENNKEADNTTNINWFPGHMTKAKRAMEDVLKSVDMIIELRDARAPFACENPLLESLIQNKPRLILLTKIDVADKDCVQHCIDSLTKEDVHVMGIDNSKLSINAIVNQCNILMKPKHDRQLRRGIRPRATRAMVAGVPNVGKSTFINAMGKKRKLIAENRPGVTQSITWIVVNDQLHLADTPGLLWNKFEDQQKAIHLALINSIKQDVVDKVMLSDYAMDIMLKYYVEQLKSRYSDFDASKPFESIAASCHCDIEKARIIFLNDLNAYRIKGISYEGHMQ